MPETETAYSPCSLGNCVVLGFDQGLGPRGHADSESSEPYEKRLIGKLRIDPDKLGKFSWVAEPGYRIAASEILYGLKKKRPDRGFLRALQKLGTRFFYINSMDGNAIINSPGGWKALHHFYTNTPQTETDEWIESLPAVRGTRERFRKYVELQRGAAINEYRERERIDHLELFAGAALPQAHVYSELISEGMDPSRISLRCVDRDPEAKEKAEQIAHENGFSDIMKFEAMDVREALDNVGGEWGIVGSHGGYDYFDDQEAVDLTEKISRIHRPGGKLFTTNMLPWKYHKDSLAMICMKGAGGWDMIREREEYDPARLIEESGAYGDIRTFINLVDSTIELNGTSSPPKNSADSMRAYLGALFGPRKVHVITESTKKNDLLALE